MPTFDETFGAEFGRDRPQSQWDKPFFDNRNLTPENRFVAWIDLMGAANHMLISLPKAASFIGKIHDAGIQAQYRYTNVSIHPIADGFYAICDQWQALRDYTARVMRSLAHCFDIETDDCHRFLVRAGVAYGRFVDGTQMAGGSNTFNGEDAYLRNVLVGCPLAWAYKAESKAPPFGIYIDQSVTTHSGERVAWVLHHWWNDAQAPWAKQFGNKVKEHLHWLNRNTIGTRYPPEKHAAYVNALTEYFDL